VKTYEVTATYLIETQGDAMSAISQAKLDSQMDTVNLVAIEASLTGEVDEPAPAKVIPVEQVAPEPEPEAPKPPVKRATKKKVAKKAPAKKSEEVAADAAIPGWEDNQTPGIDELRVLGRQLLQTNRKDDLGRVLAQFGTTSISALDAQDYPECVKALTEAVENG